MRKINSNTSKVHDEVFEQFDSKCNDHPTNHCQFNALLNKEAAKNLLGTAVLNRDSFTRSSKTMISHTVLTGTFL